LKPTGRHVAKTVCKVAASGCVSCHMPKYEVPQTHTLFTDHEIRMVPTRVLDISEMIR
jgi:formate-dependent nitrite reductase cytochrome c552 subunit